MIHRSKGRELVLSLDFDMQVRLRYAAALTGALDSSANAIKVSGEVELWRFCAICQGRKVALFNFMFMTGQLNEGCKLRAGRHSTVPSRSSIC